MTESIKLLNFRRITDMPERIVSECKRMGRETNGHLRQVITDHFKDSDERACKRFRSSYILEVDGKIVGWVCLYDWLYEGTPWVGVWVKHKHRRKGYGRILMDIAWKRWNHMFPRAVETFGRYWTGKRHRQREVISRRRLSPNASVNTTHSQTTPDHDYWSSDFFNY